MNVKVKVLAAVAALQLIVPTVFAQTSVYQVSGRVVEINSARIIIRQRGSSDLVILRNNDTRVWGPLRVGDRVTVEYKMVATSAQLSGPPRTR